jgi:hypothetical protein
LQTDKEIHFKIGKVLTDKGAASKYEEESDDDDVTDGTSTR